MNSSRRQFLHVAIGAVTVTAALQPAIAQNPAQAQNYPTKPVTIILPVAPGHSNDAATRVVADRLAQIWGQSVVILNRPGAGGIIAAQAAAAAEKDGYTLYMTQASTYTVLPITHEGKLPFDLQRDFVPIGLVSIGPIAIAINASLGVSTLPELIAHVKKMPDGVQYGAANRGGQSHLTGLLMSRSADIKLTFVHAQSSSATLNDVIAGRIPIMFEAISGLTAGLQSGGIKAVAVASEKRLPNLPDLPTVAETIPGFQSHGWVALMAPAGTPSHIVQKANADLRSVLELPEVRQKFEVFGSFIRILTPAETGDFIRREQQLWWPVVRELELLSK